MLKASKYEASHKIRFLRVVVDYNVDRMQVYRQRCHSRALLIARPLFAFRVWRYIRSAIYGHFTFFSSCLPYSGDYSTGVPPLPIPNREVKPGHADGTAFSADTNVLPSGIYSGGYGTQYTAFPEQFHKVCAAGAHLFREEKNALHRQSGENKNSAGILP